MTLPDSVADIVRQLRAGRFPNEQAISTGVVLRLLSELGWNPWDPAEVWPEYPVPGGGRVDFALCHPHREAAVLIEVKQPGRAEDGVQQSLMYAFQTGVPFVVLVDGQTWSFFLPGEQGSVDQRRVHLLDLFERSVTEATDLLRRYLAADAVRAGTALDAARREYRSRTRRGRARASLLTAWHGLVSDGTEELIDMVSAAVETHVGVRPDPDDVVDFLKRLAPAVDEGRPLVEAVGRERSSRAPLESRSGSTGDAQVVVDDDSGASSGREVTLTFMGTTRRFRTAVEAMVFALKKFGEADGTFLERCANHPKMSGRKRVYLARTPEDLYPGRADLAVHHEVVGQGWVVATNLNNALKERILRVATEVAGLQWGRDVAVT